MWLLDFVLKNKTIFLTESDTQGWADFPNRVCRIEHSEAVILRFISFPKHRQLLYKRVVHGGRNPAPSLIEEFLQICRRVCIAVRNGHVFYLPAGSNEERAHPSVFALVPLNAVLGLRPSLGIHKCTRDVEFLFFHG